MVVQCKAVLQQAGAEEVRRFEFQEHGFSQLQRVISQLFPALREAQFAVFWEDEDNDFVAISSDEELRIAIESSSEPLRLYVKTAEKCGWSLSSQSRFGTPSHRRLPGPHGWFLMMKKRWNQMKRKHATSCSKSSSSVSGCKADSSRCSDREQAHSDVHPFEAMRTFVLSLMASFQVPNEGTNSSTAASDDESSGVKAGEKEAEANKASAPPQEPAGFQHPAAGSQHPAAGPQTWHYSTEPHTGLGQPPREEQADLAPEPAVYGQGRLYPVIDSHVTTALQQLKQMGFSDEGGWLTQLVVAKDGDVGRVLDQLQPNCRRR